MSYTDVFGGNTLYPADPSYLAIALGSNIELDWPLETVPGSGVLARVIDITASGAYSITMPDARMAAPGQAILFNNLAASSASVTIKDNAGGTIATITVGTQWQVYLAATATAAGTWRKYQAGASTATVQASDLAGYGIVVTGSQLSQSMPVTTFNSSPRTVLTTDRASILVWTGSGAGTLNLPAAATAGNNFMVAVRNAGGGDLTLDPNGAETIDDAATIALSPGDSATLLTDATEWWTLGLGQDAVFAFDYTTISLAGAGATYTMSGAELNRVAYKFTGALANNVEVRVPPTIQQYWANNATTGAFTVSLNISGGTPVVIPQGSRGIYYSDGTNVIKADTASIATPFSVSDGGTGISSYTIGDLIYASGASTLSKLADVATGNALISGGVGVAPSWGKIVLTTHISGTLAVGNGGTGATTLTGVVIGNGAGAFTTVAAPAGTIVGTSDTQTLTNKRVTPRMSSTVSIASPLAWNSDNFDRYAATAQTTNFTISADAGTPTDGQAMVFRFEDNGTSRTITFTGGSSKAFQPCTSGFTVSGSNWTIATTPNKALYVGCLYNSNTARWDIVATAEEV